jgi:hypothetical protein
MSSDAAAEPMVGFGGKQAWLAVKDGEPDLLAALLGLSDLGTVSWRIGIDLAYFTDDRLVLTPPLPGAGTEPWLLAVGRWLTRPESTVDIESLSESLDTEVQYFATNRSSQRHRWCRARHGVLLRSFDFLAAEGEIVDWRGDPDETEIAVGLPTSVDSDADVLVDEFGVLRVAGAWSIDPTTLEGRPSPGPLRAAAPV